MTAVTVGDVQAAEDNVFTTTVATSGSLPEHVLVDQHTLMVRPLLRMIGVTLYVQSVFSGQMSLRAIIGSKGSPIVFAADLFKLRFLILNNRHNPHCLFSSFGGSSRASQTDLLSATVETVPFSFLKPDSC